MIKRVEIDCRAVLMGDTVEEARVIVCERTGRWAIALQRELGALSPGADVPLVEARSVQACWAALAESPAGIAVVEVTAANVDPLLGRIARLPGEFPLAAVVVVAERALVDYEWLMREAGALHFTCSIRQLGPVAQLVRRHLRQAPRPVRSVREEIWAGLPWGK